MYNSDALTLYFYSNNIQFRRLLQFFLLLFSLCRFCFFFSSFNSFNSIFHLTLRWVFSNNSIISSKCRRLNKKKNFKKRPGNNDELTNKWLNDCLMCQAISLNNALSRRFSPLLCLIFGFYSGHFIGIIRHLMLQLRHKMKLRLISMYSSVWWMRKAATE